MEILCIILLLLMAITNEINHRKRRKMFTTEAEVANGRITELQNALEESEISKEFQIETLVAQYKAQLDEKDNEIKEIENQLESIEGKEENETSQSENVLDTEAIIKSEPKGFFINFPSKYY